jgi:hypothetical protein
VKTFSHGRTVYCSTSRGCGDLPQYLRSSDRHIIPQGVTVTVSFAFTNALKQIGYYKYHLLNNLKFCRLIVITGIISSLQQTAIFPFNRSNLFVFVIRDTSVKRRVTGLTGGVRFSVGVRYFSLCHSVQFV